MNHMALCLDIWPFFLFHVMVQNLSESKHNVDAEILVMKVM